MLHRGFTPQTNSAAIELRLLGTLSARAHTGREVSAVLAQPKRVALLAYLAAATPRGFHRRDTLLGLLWPAADEEHARSSLRKAVHFLRQHLGPDVIASRGEEEIGLGPGRCWCDVAAFDEAIEAGQWERAAELYQGDLLPGMHLSDVPEFERWLEETRARLRERASRAAWTLADAEAARGQPAGAVRWARWAVERSPYDENGIRRLIGRLVEAGDWAGAVLAYEQFAQRLSADLDLRPSSDVTALVDSLRRREPSAAAQASPQAVPGHPPPAEQPWRPAGARLVSRPALLLLVALVALAGAVGGLISYLSRADDELIGHRERLLVADFDNRTADTSLATVVTDAFRIDLRQSPNVSVVHPARVTEGLIRMRLPGATRLTPQVARELAQRDGIKALVVGEVAAAGTQYVLSASLVAASTGEVLVAYRETARDSTAIVDAIDRLSKALRERIGESLATIASSPPLAQATTSSLDALRKFSQAGRAIDREGDATKALGLYEEAIELDSNFAAAYLRMTNLLYNAFPQRVDLMAWALTKAFELRDRLPPRERHLATTSYYLRVQFDFDKAIAAHKAVLDLDPRDAGTLTALGTLYLEAHRFASAESAYARALAVDSSSYLSYLNLADVQVILGKVMEASATFERMIAAFPDNAEVESWRAAFASMAWNYEEAETHIAAYLDRSGHNLNSRAWAGAALGSMAAARGRVAEAERRLRDAMRAAREAGDRPYYHDLAQDLATYYVRVLRQRQRAVREIEHALAVYPLDSLPAMQRRHVALARIYAWAGQPGRTRELLAEYEQAVDPRFRRLTDNEWPPQAARGELALAEGRFQDAIADFRQVESWGQCRLCGVEALGRAYAMAGQTDSAIAVYERYLGTPWLQRFTLDASELATVYRQLGALYERQGEVEKAKRSYQRFVELWKDCDPALRPEVARVRRRLSELATKGGR